MKLIKFLLVVIFVAFSNAITIRDLYDSSGSGSATLRAADDESARIQLQSPVHFCGDTFDEIYINTNGILTFMNEFPEFLNIQFPIEYPSISPFYSNVDITLGDASTRITYFQTSSDSNLLSRASSTIRGAFSDSVRFQATSVLIATWSNVPKWRGAQNRRERSYEKNTYQVAIISNADETYVEFLYPQGGIQWIQAETGESGLPDIRARAGFILTDGRIVEVRGSGTDKVRHLSETSNYGKPGRWLYRVGKLEHSENLKEPDTAPTRNEEPNPTSCATGGRFQCHSAANCEDNADGTGFCCKCKDGYYGNGYSCLKTGVPVRVTGFVHGHISDNQIQSQIQSYIVTSDGKSYTAMSSVGSSDLGTRLQILEIIGGVIGWVFAKPVGALYNGYQITGGKFNHTSNIRFDSGENIHVTQRFTGLNAWDQLAVEIEISGDVPAIQEGVKLIMEDFFEEFTASGSSITSVSNHRVQLSSGDPDISYTIYQNINFEPCEFSDQNQLVQFINGRMKTSKVNLAYHSNEGAVRISTLSKIGITDKTNPCMEATCGDNTLCIATSDENYECECLNGYTNGQDETCVDIDECRGSHICNENAQCINRVGGYDCHCLPGYEGNGFECAQETYLGAPKRPPYFVPTVSRCGECSENAYCHNDVCICNAGFQGNGHECHPICALDEYFSDGNCVKLSQEQEEEIQPYCNSQGDCNCPHGYKLIEYAHTSVCRIDDEAAEGEDQQESCDVVNNCHRSAECEFDQATNRYECICGPGYDGNGFDCIETEANCAQEDICDIHADCVYNSTLRKSVCVCQSGYEGTGKSCQAVVECRADADCGYHSSCNEGICECVTGYQRETNSDLCVPAGSCNGAFCAENAYCRFDSHRRINFCHCPDGYEGDGINECKFVPPPCNVRNNCGLHATCTPNYITSKYECTCDDGYAGDGVVCRPDMNCNNNPHLCDVNADCLPTANGYKCICVQGFTGNGSVCKEPPKLEVGFLIISQGVATVKIPLSGSKRGTPVSTASMAIGVDKDCAEGKVYWSDISAKSIFSSKYDGTEKQTFINTDIMSPEGIAIDWVSRRLYWTDSGKDTIEVASLDNSTLRSVLINKGLVNPRGIALDPHSKKIYWSDWNRDDPKIESANLDGSDRRLVASSPQVKLPNSLAISLNSGEVCFADAGAGNQKIECIDTYTQQSRIIADKLSYPFGLAITNEQFFWSDWTTKKIESISVDGVRNPGIQAPLFSSHKMYGMTAVTDQCQIYFSVCNVNNGDCPPNRICLVNPQSPSGKTCKCVNHADCNINDVDAY